MRSNSTCRLRQSVARTYLYVSRGLTYEAIKEGRSILPRPVFLPSLRRKLRNCVLLGCRIIYCLFLSLLLTFLFCISGPFMFSVLCIQPSQHTFKYRLLACLPASIFLLQSLLKTWSYLSRSVSLLNGSFFYPKETQNWSDILQHATSTVKCISSARQVSLVWLSHHCLLLTSAVLLQVFPLNHHRPVRGGGLWEFLGYIYAKASIRSPTPGSMMDNFSLS